MRAGIAALAGYAQAATRPMRGSGDGSLGSHAAVRGDGLFEKAQSTSQSGEFVYAVSCGGLDVRAQCAKGLIAACAEVTGNVRLSGHLTPPVIHEQRRGSGFQGCVPPFTRTRTVARIA